MGVSYNELLKATDGFNDSTNLLGIGSFGSVYKGILQKDESKPVAVKVLHLQQRGATKSFMAECDVLRKVRHRNLLKIVTCCSSIDFHGNPFKALVFEFMGNGSLDHWRHSTVSDTNNDDPLHEKNLNMERRLNIAVDVASALNYLHQLIRNGKRSVYSYGILLLEMFTGRRPTDNMFTGGLNIHNFCKMYSLPEHIEKIIDSRLLLDVEGEHHDESTRDTIRQIMSTIIKIGVKCSSEFHSNRSSMNEVIVDVEAVKNEFHSVGM
ncbi:putative receptor-like protein kinase At3g47110 [Papaver somniferum]|uniref:putative receptor-like protein kinase At3g47110 n=1 Tax=Papaver somniferum TaxID=3469 RepID=UPI000E6FAD28|nr:putative receptor-like protein kinase At3g47110 [Papaver somniferum]